MTGIKKNFRRFLQDFYLVIIMIFLYAPIATMVVLSFNQSKSRTVWGGFHPAVVHPDVLQQKHYGSPAEHAADCLFICADCHNHRTAAAIAINSMKPVSRTIVMALPTFPC